MSRLSFPPKGEVYVENPLWFIYYLRCLSKSRLFSDIQHSDFTLYMSLGYSRTLSLLAIKQLKALLTIKNVEYIICFLTRFLKVQYFMYIHLVTFLFCRMVHAFTCTGLTETQYHNFGEAVGIGSVMDKTIDTNELLSILPPPP